MKGSKLIWSTLLGCALVVGCDSKEETPAGAPASNSQATEKAASDMKSKTEDASERAKDAAADASKDAKKTAEAASDAVKKNADAAAEAANTSPAAADAEAKLKTVMDAIRDKKWDIADTTLKGLEANKASLPVAVSSQLESTRKMLDSAKAGVTAPALPK